MIDIHASLCHVANLRLNICSYPPTDIMQGGHSVLKCVTSRSIGVTMCNVHRLRKKPWARIELVQLDVCKHA
jgi:hypothetical protein